MNRLAHPAQRVAPRRAYVFLAAAALATLVALTISVGTARAVVFFNGAPGTGPPPPTLGPYAITPFPDDPRPVTGACPFSFLPPTCSVANNVSSVPAPFAAPFAIGNVFFSPSLSHRDIPVGWGSGFWGHGYAGDLYVRVFQTFPFPALSTGQPPGQSATMFLPPGTKAFRFYAKTGNGVGGFTITATTNTGATSGALPVGNVFTPARFYGFWTATPGETIAFITVTGPAQVNPTVGSLAIGEFGMFTGFAGQLPCPPEPIMAPCHGPSGGF